MDAFEKQAAARAERFPSLQDALEAMNSAYGRLVDLGWRPPAYYEHTPRPLGDQVVISTVLGSPLLHYGPEPWPGYALFRIGNAPEPNYRLMADMDRSARRILDAEKAAPSTAAGRKSDV
jgi:hypothetical protein